MLKKLLALGFLLAAAIFVVVSLPFVLPVDSYKPNLESIISKAVGREVRIGKLHFELLPFPHLAGTNVTLWSTKKKGEAVISKIEIWLDPDDLMEKKVTVRRVHFSGFSTNQAFVESVVDEWQAMQSDDSAAPAWIGLDQLSADSITVRTHDNKLLGPFQFDGRFGGEYGFRMLSLGMLDDHLRAEITPVPEGLAFDLSAQSLTPPFGPPLLIDHLTAHGMWSGATVNVSNLEVDAYGGRADGGFVMEWHGGSWQARGKWNARNVRLEPINALIGYRTVTGTADGDFDFWFKGPSLKDLLKDIHITTQLSLRDGAIHSDKPLFQFAEITTQAVLSNRGIKFSNFSAKAYDGLFTSPALEISWADGWTIEGDVQTRDVNVAPMVENFVSRSPLDGMLNSNLKVKLEHRKIEQLFDHPAVSGQARLSNARVFSPSRQGDGAELRKPWLEFSELEFDGVFDNSHVDARSLRALGYGGELHGSNLQLHWLPQWKLEGQLKSRHIQVQDVLALFELPPYVTGETTGQFTLSMQGADRDAFLASPIVSGQVQINNGTVPKIDTSSERSDAQQGPWLTFDYAAAKFNLEDDSIRFDTFTMGGYGGRLLARSSHLSWAEQWRLSGVVDAEKIDLESLLRGFQDEKSVSGTFAGRMAVKFQHEKIENLFDSPVLAGQFIVDKGVVYKADLEKASHGGASSNPQENKTAFDRLAGVIFTKNGKIRLSNLEIQSPSLHARGKLNISEDKQLSGSLAVGLRSTGSLVSVPLNVSGDTANPSLALSGGTVFGGALGTSLLGPGVGTIVGMGTGKLFSGIASLFTHSKEESEKEAAELKAIEQELTREFDPAKKPDS